jgi:hypothetical protein
MVKCSIANSCGSSFRTIRGGEEAFQKLSGDRLQPVLVLASQASFRAVALLPAILLVVFGAILAL